MGRIDDGLVAMGDSGIRDAGNYRLRIGYVQNGGVDVLIAYGQVKGKRYDNIQQLPTGAKKKSTRYRRPVVWGGKRFDSVADLARMLHLTEQAVYSHLKRNTPLKGKRVKYE